MTTYLGKSCSFAILYVSFMNVYQFFSVCLFPFRFEGGMLDLVVLIPDHCLSIYFSLRVNPKGSHDWYQIEGLEKILNIIQLKWISFPKPPSHP